MKHHFHDHRRNVLELQWFLRANHRLEGGVLINPDGIYGKETTAAVKLFQRQNGMDETGNADYQTWEVLRQNAEFINNEPPNLDFDNIQ